MKYECTGCNKKSVTNYPAAKLPAPIICAKCYSAWVESDNATKGETK